MMNWSESFVTNVRYSGDRCACSLCSRSGMRKRFRTCFASIVVIGGAGGSRFMNVVVANVVKRGANVFSALRRQTFRSPALSCGLLQHVLFAKKELKFSLHHLPGRWTLGLRETGRWCQFGQIDPRLDKGVPFGKNNWYSKRIFLV